MSKKKRDYDNAILMFALIQAVIGMLQFVLAIVSAATVRAQWVGAFCIVVLVGFMYFLMKKMKSI